VNESISEENLRGRAGGLLGQSALSHTLALVREISVTGTPGEQDFSRFLARYLRALPAFADGSAQIFRQPVPGPPEGRECVAALVKGRGRGTVVLCGHFDVVGIADYGDLQELAGEPFALATALIERLAATGEDPRALADLRSGEYLPGRGLLDMKAGLGAGIAVLEAFAANDERVGNLLFLGVPDEENQSAGMRAAGPLLARIAQEHGLDLALAINLDALQDDRSIGLGCVGKHLVTTYVVGHEAHACYPFNGLSAAYLASAIVQEMEYEPDLAEGEAGTMSAAPVTLLQSDLREGYDVTTPARSWCAFNIITRRRSGREVLDRSAEVVRRALARALAARRERQERAGERGGVSFDNVPVLTFEEVDARAAADAGYGTAKVALAAKLRSRAELTMPERARRMTELAVETARITGPCVVLGFGGLSYPPVPALRMQAEFGLEATVRESVAQAAELAGVDVAIRDQLAVITDMSFPGAYHRAEDMEATRDNPLWPDILSWDIENYPRLPIVNIGPSGRDYHRFVERAEIAYTFAVLPRIVDEVARAVLAR
jgi:arginine utilization protein RocB